MTEQEAFERLEHLKRGLRIDASADYVNTHLNEIHRFLIEFCCPGITAAARAKLNRLYEDPK